ncbi:MAG: hypothetical protein SFV18_04255 [Bryobacteraceae bacterium]|nr:hypothetical protein [Bryobacteraceae bacterium]
MRRWIWIAGALAVGAQSFPQIDHTKPEPVRLPNGKLQSEEILKSDHEQTLKDLAEMKKLLANLEDELSKNDRHVLSIGAIKKLEDVERLSKKIRSRMTKR